jgi:hypothetical protein
MMEGVGVVEKAISGTQFIIMLYYVFYDFIIYFLPDVAPTIPVGSPIPQIVVGRR